MGAQKCHNSSGWCYAAHSSRVTEEKRQQKCTRTKNCRKVHTALEETHPKTESRVEKARCVGITCQSRPRSCQAEACSISGETHQRGIHAVREDTLPGSETHCCSGRHNSCD